MNLFNTIKSDLNDRNINLDDIDDLQDLRELAVNRCNWRKLLDFKT